MARKHFGGADRFNDLGIAAAQAQRHEEAIEFFRRAIQIERDFPEALNNWGFSLGALGKFKEAAPKFERAIRLRPSFASAHGNLGLALLNLKRPQAAVQAFTKALELEPRATQLHVNLGAAQRELGDPEAALASLEQALRLDPNSASALLQKGLVLVDLGNFNDAAACYIQALKINPRFADAYNNLGVALLSLGRRGEAVESFNRAIALSPADAVAHYNLGLAFEEAGQLREAARAFLRSSELDPHRADTFYRLGVLYSNSRMSEEAISWFNGALKADDRHAPARAQRLHQLAKICDWKAVAAEQSTLATLGLTNGAVPPFALLSLEDRPERHRIRGERFAEQIYGPGRSFPFAPASPGDKIKLGYFSADFRSHAVAHLIIRVLELHDRARFTVQAFSHGPDTKDEMRARVVNAVDAFHDVRGFGDAQVAELARTHGVDIAIDLTGYTQGARTGIFANAAAPVQINYLGYPGTMGAPFMDYIIADRVLIPEEFREHYAESVVFLPHTYQPNDNTRELSKHVSSRDMAGLPADGFVFCSFNNAYKIGAAEFDVWMTILRQTPGSVLWLLEPGETASRALRSEASARGVEPERLVFAPPLPQAEHLARHRLADLFLDTFNYNAHTTASDALWAGLPLVTKLGEGFAARVCGSLLSAAGLPELITTTEDAYATLACELAARPDRIASLKAKVAASRTAAPLFNAALFTKHIESAFEQVHARRLAGQRPTDIRVA
ncbi:MAG: tetratricopeptide repeat protein [Hyphomonadaceae bacterium]